MIAALRLIYEMLATQGASPACALDTNEAPNPLQFTGLTADRNETLQLAPAATDVAVTFTAAIGLVITSDEPFSLRRATGETLWPNCRAFVVWAADTDGAVASTSVLLSGNGANTATVRIQVIEAP